MEPATDAKSSPREIVDRLCLDPPLIPRLAVELVGLASQPPAAQAERLVSICTEDDALAKHVRRVAAKQPTVDPHKELDLPAALDVLGLEQARDSLFYRLIKGSFNQRDIVDGAFFQHCHHAAIGAMCMAELVDEIPRTQAFVVGLLHDVGQLVMRLLNRPLYDRVVERVLVSPGTDAFEEAEVALFGCSHSAVGAELLHACGLPEVMAEALHAHHNLDQAHLSEPGLRLAAVVRVSDGLTEELGFGALPSQIDRDLPRAKSLSCSGAEFLGLAGQALPPVVDRFWALCDAWADLLS